MQNADFLDGPFDAVFETRQEQIVTPKIWAPLLSTRKKTLTGIFAPSSLYQKKSDAREKERSASLSEGK